MALELRKLQAGWVLGLSGCWFGVLCSACLFTGVNAGASGFRGVMRRGVVAGPSPSEHDIRDGSVNLCEG